MKPILNSHAEEHDPNIFWNALEHSCKFDQLVEPNHTHLVISALRDPETCIESHVDGTFTLYGESEALLVIPRLVTTRLLLWLFFSIKSFQSTQLRLL